jgi:predicted transcriptional regulator YdeE
MEGKNMYEITKSYIQSIPAVRFIGIKYRDEDRVGGGFGSQWGNWFENNRFEKLEALMKDELKKVYEDADAYIGFMRWKEGEPFQYWIGMFLPEGTDVPEGYDFVDMPEGKLGVCWLHGPEGELYCKEDKCAEKLVQEGHEIISDENGAWWFFERYGCPRFTTPDEEGQVILDICHYIK